MGFLNNIFGSNLEPLQPNINWIPLTSLAQLDEITSLSFERPIAIFKHSTRCGISRMALKTFENDFDPDTKVTAYFVDLLAHREVSSAISEKFNVVHQSPQLLLVKDGKSVYDVSHGEIDAEALADKV
jgi:bacillithiol system protein YtxJ